MIGSGNKPSSVALHDISNVLIRIPNIDSKRQCAKTKWDCDELIISITILICRGSVKNMRSLVLFLTYGN